MCCRRGLVDTGGQQSRLVLIWQAASEADLYCKDEIDHLEVREELRTAGETQKETPPYTVSTVRRYVSTCRTNKPAAERIR